MKVMIDTNIILDVYMNRDPFVQSSTEVLRLAENKQIEGIISANAVTDIYYILRKYTKDSVRLRTIIKKLLTIISVSDVLGTDITEAFFLPMDDYEDALMAQCAKRIEADCIVTRNIRDFINAPVLSILPDELLAKFL